MGKRFKDKLTVITAAVLVTSFFCGVTYLFGAIVAWSFNPYDWHWFLRGFVFFWIFVIVLRAFFLAWDDIDKI